MKRLIRSTGFKITAVILMILTFCITLLGAVSMIYFIDRGFYDNTKDQLKKNQYHMLAYNDCYDVMDGILYGYVPVQKEQEGYNFRYQVYDYKNNTIADSTYNDEDFCFSLTLHYYYDPFSSQHYSDQWYNDENPPRYTITGYVLESLEYEDKYRINSELIDIGYDFRYTVILITGLSLLLTCILLILLLVGAGRRNTDEDIHLTFFDYWPYDLLLLGMLLLVILVFEILNYGPGAAVFLLLTIGCILCVPILLTTAVRLKARVLFRYTLCYHLLRGLRWLLQRIAHGLKQLIQNLPLLWQVLTGCIVICLIEAFFVILVASYTLEPVDLLPLWIIEKIILTGGVLYITLQMRRLQQGASKIAAGDLQYQIDTHALIGPFERHGQDLNNIRLGMQAAVETKLRSERMKTELITNVSHDIKTPLTSIINYVDLLKKEELPNDTTREYVKVLDRQSARLKKLIEDLVEASKASTGNLAVSLEPCEVGILLSQACAEYDDRLREAGLEPIMTLPDSPTLILADGRHLWRVFDNLLNNIVKYAQPGTRVYMTLHAQQNDVSITFRNISKTMLNISAEDLMERFVRGDSSRNTEGSGLGLSIARSLTELQHGSMDLAIDGDLFKVTLSFKKNISS